MPVAGGGTGGSGTSVWTATVIKAADQSVTNNAAMQNDTDLKLTAALNSVWFVQVYLYYDASSTTGDYSCNFTFPSTTVAWCRWIAYQSAADARPTSGSSACQGLQTLGSDIALGGSGGRSALIEVGFSPLGGSGTCQFVFANTVAGGGFVSTTKAGSVLRAYQVA